MALSDTLKKTALYVAPFAAAGVETFAEYVINSGQPLSRDTLVHAFMAAVVLETGLIKIQVQKAVTAAQASTTVVVAPTIPSPVKQ